MISAFKTFVRRASGPRAIAQAPGLAARMEIGLRHSVLVVMTTMLFAFPTAPSSAAEASNGTEPLSPNVRLAPSNPALDAWRKTMRTQQTGDGQCFSAQYPDTTWKAVPCVAAPTNSVAPLTVPAPLRPADTGNNSDWMALAPNPVSTFVGSITEIDNYVQGHESDSGEGAGAYSLQLNSNGFTPPSSICSGCTGLVQFMYDWNGKGLFIQDWMLNYITKDQPQCPANWLNAKDQNGNPTPNCYNNPVLCGKTGYGLATTVPAIDIADLPNTTLEGQAMLGGEDVATLNYGGVAYKYTACDAFQVAASASGGLANNWTAAEFNLLGDLDSNRVTFSDPGVLMNVKIDMPDISPGQGVCGTVASNGGGVTTVETTNLTLAKCAPTTTGVSFAQGTPPTISSFAPPSGPQDGETDITVAGQGFSQATEVSFNFTGAVPETRYPVICTPTQCRFASPPGTLTATVDIENTLSSSPEVVTGPPATPAPQFSYLAFPEGEISPATGPFTGRTPVTLQGHNFGLAPGATRVLFDINGVETAAVDVTCENAPPTSLPAYDNICTFQAPAFPNPPSAGTVLAPVTATVAGLTSTVGGFTYGSTPVQPPQNWCKVCMEHGDRCVIHNGVHECECPRSSPTGVCQ